MKIILSIITIYFSLFISLKIANADQTNSFVHAFDTSVAVYEKTNLVVFGPPYGTNPPANVPEMLSTNGLSSWLGTPSVPISGKRPDLGVYVYNHATNYMACLRMPATNLCRVALYDKYGNQVKKTAVGSSFGQLLSQEQIDGWRHHWKNSHESLFIKLLPNGLPECKNLPTEICNFSVKDAFVITESGEYELHVQLRLVQIGTDSFGKFYYPISWLPEVVTKVNIKEM